MVISIDGMSGTGKSTISYLIANKLHLGCLNSGSIYRCIALKIMNNEETLESIIKNIEKLNINFINKEDKQLVYLDNKDVTEEIRKEEVSVFTPTIANNQELKKAIRKLQAVFVNKGNVVIEGRDIGVRIAPNADYKFYLTTSLEVRAQRLYKEKKERENITYEEIYNDLKQRDEKDIEDGNFIKPTDAINIDTSNLTIDEVVDLMLSYIK